MEVVVSIDERGRILLPKALRRKLDVRAGSKLLLRARDDGVIELIPLDRLVREVSRAFESKFRDWREDLHEASKLLESLTGDRSWR